MKIIDLKTNHLVNPLGYELEAPHFSWRVVGATGKKQVAAKIEVALDEQFNDLLFSSTDSEVVTHLATELPLDIKLAPRTRYYWHVEITTDKAERVWSDVAWFETGKMTEEWQGQWISPTFANTIQPTFHRDWQLSTTKDIQSSRVYICGLGLYELSINGKKVGDEYLTPGYNAYNHWLQYQTYDTTHLKSGDNHIEVSLGDGWYKGQFGLGPALSEGEIYGTDFQLLVESHVVYTDGTTATLVSDLAWQVSESHVRRSGIYFGERLDLTADTSQRYPVKHAMNSKLGALQERLNPAITINHRINPQERFISPTGELIIDMGQNMVGWLEIALPAVEKGHEIAFEFGEVLQAGNFYRDNLNFAEARFEVVSNGEAQSVRPHFTFYGFRYVKVSGLPDLALEDVSGCVLYSNLEETSEFSCSHPLVTRLYQNAKWSQRGNFVDVPTDCPQRSERLGWTGDAQVFADTACYNMDVYAFFTKYGHDLGYEQATRNGSVPFVVPLAFKNVEVDSDDSMMPRQMSDGSTGWGEAATVIPWKVWQHYGDKRILERQYDSMKSWVDYMYRQDEADGGKRLWQTGFHFGDWLGLDNYVGAGYDERIGGTDQYFIASVYYYYSTLLVAKSADVIGKTADAAYYFKLASAIQASVNAEYLSENGHLVGQTQTGLVLALYTEVIYDKHRPRLVADLVALLKANDYHLTTGFVGSPYLCLVLSKYGYQDIAYQLLLNEDLPSWLFQIKMGATTIWERWDSVREDGTMNPSGMNSLNHYAYGAIVEWLYKHMLGIQPLEEHQGYTKVRLAPQPDYRVTHAEGSYNSISGKFESAWELLANGELHYQMVVPFNTSAEIILRDADADKMLKTSGVTFTQVGQTVWAEVEAGSYHFAYLPTKVYADMWSAEAPIGELLTDSRIKDFLTSEMPQLVKEAENSPVTAATGLAAFLWHPFLVVADEQVTKVKTFVESLVKPQP